MVRKDPPIESQAGSLSREFLQFGWNTLPLIGGEGRPFFGRQERVLGQRAFSGARFVSSEEESPRDRGRRLRAELTYEERKDGLRTAYLNQQGYRVLRFWNEQINRELEGVARCLCSPDGFPIARRGGALMKDPLS